MTPPAGHISVETPAPGGPPAVVGALAPTDLAELIGAFNEVTTRLQGTHENLQREVAALKLELHEANERLSRSRRLAALGEMAAGIAHEIRNPLSSISLYARMLQQDLADRPGERTVAVKIGAAVRRLDAVVSDVLNFSRELKVRPASNDAAELLEQALESCSPEIPAGVRVVTDNAGAPPLECDTGLVRQALVNLILNALQAMADSPPVAGAHTLTLSCGPGTVQDERGGTVRLIVGDTGPGVPLEVRDRMFNPFFTTRATGTGLGLAIVHRIVDAHGGRIHVRNRVAPDRGAVIELHFPVRAAPMCSADGARFLGSPATGDSVAQETDS